LELVSYILLKVHYIISIGPLVNMVDCVTGYYILFGIKPILK